MHCQQRNLNTILMHTLHLEDQPLVASGGTEVISPCDFGGTAFIHNKSDGQMLLHCCWSFLGHCALPSTSTIFASSFSRMSSQEFPSCFFLCPHRVGHTSLHLRKALFLLWRKEALQKFTVLLHPQVTPPQTGFAAALPKAVSDIHR